MIGNYIVVFSVISIFFAHFASGGYIKPYNTTVTATFNRDFGFTWNVVKARDEKILAARVFFDTKINKADDFALEGTRPPSLTDYGTNLFGDRLSASFINNQYRIYLRRIMFNETYTVRLQIVFDLKGSFDSQYSTVAIKVAVGGSSRDVLLSGTVLGVVMAWLTYFIAL
ncbi:uncharacterized protein LOC130636453 [Hydractinia symbiolongicarpus]|uniref:uncharacterized protein LOC130636453 n=1 Tax=Hydractinia symbiolongicarpus TaxID=13093 RepID=UPI00254C0F86|nr:uncharacterized protein LOC130636453 [Hydractinia symbiolongicarpus]